MDDHGHTTPRNQGQPDILIVAESGEAGGIGRYCADHAALLGSRAHIACLCSNACDGRSCWLAGQAKACGIELIRLPMPPRAWRLGLLGLTRQWRRSGRPIVHVNGRRGNFVSLTARLFVPGYRFVTTVHGVLGLHDRRNVLYRVIDLAATRAARRVIAVSADTRRRLLRAGSPASRTIVVLNGLRDTDLAALRSIAAQRTIRVGSTIRVGYLGRLSAEKGTAELLEVARGLVTMASMATLTIGGDGPERIELEAAAGSMSDGVPIALLGTVRDVPAFLAGIDILVIPSRNEGLPYVLLEAMAAGCAVVAFRVGGIPEVVRDNSMGLLIEPGDIDEFVRAVVSLVGDPARVHRLGQGAAAHVATHFALRDRMLLLRNAYGLAVDSGPPTGRRTKTTAGRSD